MRRRARALEHKADVKVEGSVNLSISPLIFSILSRMTKVSLVMRNITRLVRIRMLRAKAEIIKEIILIKLYM